jgi:hypothetical protein
MPTKPKRGATSWNFDAARLMNDPHVLLKIHVIFTERRGRVVKTPASYSGGPGFKCTPGEVLS